MFDCHLIPVIRSPLTQLAKPLCRAGISANQVSLIGFAIGMLALPLLAFGSYQWALATILLNRLLDGLDGAVARETGITDCGGFLDITLDFIFYAAVVLGFALAAPANALPAATLLFAFMGTGSSFLAFAIMAGKRGIDNPVYHHKSLYYLGGLTEGSETIALFVLMCLWPAAFAPLAYGFALLCAITTLTRLWSGYHTLRPPSPELHSPHRRANPSHDELAANKAHGTLARGWQCFTMTTLLSVSLRTLCVALPLFSLCRYSPCSVAAAAPLRQSPWSSPSPRAPLSIRHHRANPFIHKGLARGLRQSPQRGQVRPEDGREARF